MTTMLLRMRPSDSSGNLPPPIRPVNLRFPQPSYLTKGDPMKKRNLSILLASLFVIVGAVVAGSGRMVEGEIPAPPAIGATIEEFSLPDVDGRERSLRSLAGKNGTVLIFIAVQCPVSNAYNERMEQLSQDYKAKGIAVIGINANSIDDAAAVKAHAAEKHLTFPILKDPANKI